MDKNKIIKTLSKLIKNILLFYYFLLLYLRNFDIESNIFYNYLFYN